MYKKHHSNKNSHSGSWQKVAPWYNKLTEGGSGHYYHTHVIIPNVIRLLEINAKSQMLNAKLLDLACGNGVLAKSLPKEAEYLGVDISESLVKFAKYADKNISHKYIVADVTKPLTIPTDFTNAVIILALQNIQKPQAALSNVSRHLIKGGRLVIVLNHPMFRIPRQSSWGVEPARKIQYRRIDRYLSPMSIPIRINPSDPSSESTMTYHYPLSTYSKMLKEAGFFIELIEEWSSDKESEGRTAKMENRSRSEIPLFLTIVAVKKN